MPDTPKPLHIGIIREGKTPPDRRVPFTPDQCVQVLNQFPGTQITVQAGPVRCIADEAYRQAGITVADNLTDCDVIFGVKEVPVRNLQEDKTYFIFSHTFKKQPYNRRLLQTVLARQIRLIDYELLTKRNGQRIIGFGRFAGLVGAYNTLMAYGLRNQLYELKRATDCGTVAEMIKEFKKKATDLPNIKIVLTGTGRVGQGIAELLNGCGFSYVPETDFLKEITFDKPVYTVLDSHHYYELPGHDWDKDYFYQYPQEAKSTFLPYTKAADLLITGAYWNPQAPRLFELTDTHNPDFRLQVIGDVSCDIDGGVPCNRQASTIVDPFYDYDPLTNSVQPAFSKNRHITMMTIDNLPCELPLEASESFGRQIIEQVLPRLSGKDAERIIERGTIAQEGRLMPGFAYLSRYVAGLE